MSSRAQPCQRGYWVLALPVETSICVTTALLCPGMTSSHASDCPSHGSVRRIAASSAERLHAAPLTSDVAVMDGFASRLVTHYAHESAFGDSVQVLAMELSVMAGNVSLALRQPIVTISAVCHREHALEFLHDVAADPPRFPHRPWIYRTHACLGNPRKGRTGPCITAAGVSAHDPGIGPTQLRWTQDYRGACEDAGRMAG